MNIRFSGFGGQGIVLSGVILGRAAVLEGKMAIQTQSYGSESRGGACRSDVAISNQEIHELESPEVDVLVAMSQQAYERYLPSLKENGTLIVERDLVEIPDRVGRRRVPMGSGSLREKPKNDVKSRGDNVALRETGLAPHRMVQGLITGKRTTKPGVSTYAISATDIAFKKFGRKIIANMVVLGYMTALLGILSPENLKEAIKENVPEGTEAVNISAFEEGCALGKTEAED